MEHMGAVQDHYYLPLDIITLANITDLLRDTIRWCSLDPHYLLFAQCGCLYFVASLENSCEHEESLYQILESDGEIPSQITHEALGNRVCVLALCVGIDDF